VEHTKAYDSEQTNKLIDSNSRREAKSNLVWVYSINHAIHSQRFGKELCTCDFDLWKAAGVVFLQAKISILIFSAGFNDNA
jgi:hypothetical protein